MSSHRSDLRVIQGSPQRLRPPDDLAPAEKEIFADIVGAVDPKHFAASDLPLLTSYCVAINQEREANRHLRTEGYIIDGKPSPWVVIQEKSHRMMTALSMRLRLAPQSRTRTKVRSDRVSAYERLAVLEGNDNGGD
jgi:P27 family predicted phage terminase small subunit